MPFGLKTASSLFQKAITRIFGPIQDNALIYINDILLFSCTEKDHVELLLQFHNIVKNHGIMLSKKKMLIGMHSIEFLGMKISNGTYTEFHCPRVQAIDLGRLALDLDHQRL